jgi:hypothetical protein
MASNKLSTPKETNITEKFKSTYGIAYFFRGMTNMPQSALEKDG